MGKRQRKVSKRLTELKPIKPVTPEPKPKRKKTVSWKWKHPRGHIGILAIDSGDGQGKIPYLVRRLDTPEITFNVSNLNKTESRYYEVAIWPEYQDGHCTCAGFKAYGTCRHFEALSTKVANGDALNR